MSHSALLPWPFSRPSPLEPPREYGELRTQSATTKVAIGTDARPALLLLRHADVKEALLERGLSANVHAPDFPVASETAAAAKRMQKSFVRMDPPEHSRYRSMVAGEFRQERVDSMRPAVVSAVESLLDELESLEPPVDLIQQYASRVPATVVCFLLDRPLSDAPFIADRVSAWTDYEAARRVVTRAGSEVLAYLDGVVRARATDAREDLISRLLINHVQVGELTPNELLHMMFLITVSGFHTTAGMIGLSAMALLQRPEEIADLRDQPLNGGSAAVEELLRYLTVAHLTAIRRATRDMVVAGEEVRAGDGVLASLVAANHDPTVFARPDQMDLRRTPNPHLAFGHGEHRCLGSALARMELTAAITSLFRRFPNLRLAVPPDSIRPKLGATIGLRELPVSW